MQKAYEVLHGYGHAVESFEVCHAQFWELVELMSSPFCRMILIYLGYFAAPQLVRCSCEVTS